MKIELPNGRKIGPGEPCFVVAEIGQNHQGDVYTAMRLAIEANRAGVDAVKLCKRHVPSDLTAAAFNAPYTGPQAFGPTYGRHREALELSIADYAHLQDRFRYNEYPQILFATACDERSVDELESIDVPLYKIASRDLDNQPLIDYVARTGKPLILSTGFCTRPHHDRQIDQALATVWRYHSRVVLLYCVSEYPTPDEHIWLPRLEELRERYDVPIGFSDHTVGIHLAQAAVLGACVIEKHLTLSRAMKGTDHAASLEPAGLQKLVRNIRSIERSLDPGRPIVDVSAARKKLGRSLTSRVAIRPGETITEEMVCLKSPGDGVHWPERQKILGHRARLYIPADTTLDTGDVEIQPPTPYPL